MEIGVYSFYTLLTFLSFLFAPQRQYIYTYILAEVCGFDSVSLNGTD